MEGGDLFFPLAAPQPAREMIDLKVDLFLEAYNRMGYNALVPGENDLALGVQYLLGKKEKAKFPFLLANLVDRKNGKPVFSSVIVKDLNGIRVGVFGLLSDDYLRNGPSEEKERFQLLPPIEAAHKVVQELKKKKCQVIIAVTHMGLEENRSLAQALPEIRFIVNGHTQEAKAEPIRLNQTDLLSAGSRGEFLGRLDLSRRENRVDSLYRLSPMGERYADHPLIADLLTQYKDSLGKLAASGRQMPGDAPRTPGQPFSYRLPSYVGESVCLPCHEKQHQAWQKTAHAKAFQTLISLNKASDITCLPCHTTGFGELNSPGEILENVQCEACHGPRRGHPDPQKKFAAAEEKQCLTCHTAAKRPNYHYRTYLLKVGCPK